MQLQKIIMYKINTTTNKNKNKNKNNIINNIQQEGFFSFSFSFFGVQSLWNCHKSKHGDSCRSTSTEIEIMFDVILRESDWWQRGQRFKFKKETMVGDEK